jgi:hypothetical protein
MPKIKQQPPGSDYVYGECYEHDIRWYTGAVECPLCAANAELQALREAVEAAKRLEIEVKPTPNGNKVLVIWDGSVFEELATALAKLEAKGE